MKKLTVCKACGNQVAKSARKCPHCGHRRHTAGDTVAIIFGLFFIFILVGIILSSTEDDKPTKASVPTASASAVSERPSATPKPTPTPEPVFSIGDTAEMRDIQVTLLDVRNSYGNSLFSPDPGYVFLIFELEIANNSTSDIGVSSLLSFSAYADDYALQISVTGVSADDTPTLDGTIAAGKKMRGIAVFQAQEGWETAEIRFKPSIWSGREFIFTATAPD